MKRDKIKKKFQLKMNRRQVLKAGMIGGAAMMVPWKFKVPNAFAAGDHIEGGTLHPEDVTKYLSPLVIPPAVRRMGKIKASMGKNAEYYEIAVKQFNQQIMPAGMPQTTVWSYGPANLAPTLANGYFYPAFTLENKFNKPTVVKWVNGLVDSNGNHLPHLLPVDPTLHWANPPGGSAGRDKRPSFTSTPGPYTGPVPIVTHVHGAHTREESDGYPEAWYLPAANDIPAEYATTGTFYDYYYGKYAKNWSPGSATFEYPNDQSATTLWYHDHTLGMTRLNVYAGPAGFYMVRGGPNDMDLGYTGPGTGIDPFGMFTEIPIAIQDRSFNSDGSLFYPDTREFFDGFPVPYVPDSPVSPIWNPEFFGNMMVVNGQTWPYLEVEQRRYRFRLLNGCNSRFLVLKMTSAPRGDNTGFNTGPFQPFWQIGADQGFLSSAVQLNQLLMAPAERADVIVDFTNVPVGTEIYLVNDGPDAPFGGISSEDLSDWQSTGQVMKFIVKASTSPDVTTPPDQLVLPAAAALGNAPNTHNVSLNEEVYEPADVPFAALLGTHDTGTGQPTPLLWSSNISENPDNNSTEQWSLYNFTEDAHPIHVHLVKFQLVGREPFGGGTSTAGQNTPLPGETGFKDTIIAYPGEITRIKATYDIPGLYVHHCHIVEHEDNEMMRPFHVGPIDPNAPLPDNA